MDQDLIVKKRLNNKGGTTYSNDDDEHDSNDNNSNNKMKWVHKINIFGCFIAMAHSSLLLAGFAVHRLLAVLLWQQIYWGDWTGTTSACLNW